MNQTEKYKYHIVSLIHVIKKIIITQKLTDTENKQELPEQRWVDQTETGKGD